MLNKIIEFLFKKKVETLTGTMTQTSKTKVFMTLEGILRAIEFASPHFGHPIVFPESVHVFIYTLAGLSYAERANTAPKV